MAGNKTDPAGAAPDAAGSAAGKAPRKASRKGARAGKQAAAGEGAGVPQDAPTQEQEPATRRRYRWLWLLALILVAGGGGAWLGFHYLGQYPARMDRLEANVERIAALEFELAELKRNSAEQAADARAARQAGESARDVLETRLAAAESALAVLGGVPGGQQSRWKLDAAESLLSLAHRQSRFAKDYAGAALALREALELLAQIGDPRYAGLRADLQEQARTLERIPPRDVQAVVVRLGALLSRIEGLQPAARPQSSAPASGEQLPSGGWQRAVASVGRALRSLITVRRAEDGAEAFLTQNDAQALGRLLAAELNMARLAYIRGDAEAYSAALRAARERMARLYSPANPDVADTLADIDELLKRDGAPETPDLAASLARLRAIRPD